MTVSAQTPINRSTGNGVTTVFPYTFKIISSADMEVSVDGVVKTLTVDYTLSGVGDDAGGNVTMLAAPATSTSVVRRRNMALTRNTDYQDQGELPASTLDSDLDSAVLMIQQVDEKTDRAMVLPTYVSGFSTELPTPIANYFLRVNPTATAMEMVSAMEPRTLAVSPYIETLLDDLNEAAARATLGVPPRAASINVASVAGTVDLTTSAPDTDDIQLTGNNAITGFTVAVGRVIRFVVAGGATPSFVNGASLNTKTGSNVILANGDSGMLRATAANTMELLCLTKIPTTRYSTVTGLTLSTAGVSAFMGIAVGQVMDSTGAVLMVLTSAITKAGGAWAVGTGNGGIDTGTFTANLTYHWYLIRRPDTGVIDAIFSLSASAPTLPANYTQYAAIGSVLSIAGVVWRKFIQVGREFWYDASTYDIGANNPGTAAVTRTLSIPTGRVLEAIFNGGLVNTSTGVSGGVFFSPLFKSDEAPSGTTAPLWSSGALASNGAGGATQTHVPQRCLTNTSAQIRSRLSASDANMTIHIVTLGYRDFL